MKRFILFLTTFALLLSIPFSVSGAAKYETPVKPDHWKDPNFSTDHAFSIALVGDTQNLSRGDCFQGTKKMDQLFSYITDTAKDRKLAHVFVLGDITDLTYHNDGNLASARYYPHRTVEWENAQKAIFKMSKAGISYSLCRGNHDDHMINDFFNVPTYTDQFKGVGGFYTDLDAKYKNHEEKNNKEGYVYWSALSGKLESTIENSYKTMEILGTKYIFITLDYNPTDGAAQWLDQLLTQYSDHTAILATHSFTKGNGGLIDSEKGDTHFPLGNTADKIWREVLRNHENLLMVVSGHKAVTKPLVKDTLKGANGNTVNQILVDPQGYDTKELEDGTVKSGTQDTGMVLYLNFHADGKTVTMDYYSTLLNKEMNGITETLILKEKDPYFVANKDNETETKTTTTAAPTSHSVAELEGGGSNNIILILVGTIVAVGIGVLLIFLLRKKKQKTDQQ